MLSSAQQINGVVKTEDEKILNRASVTIRNAFTQQIYAFTVTNNQGQFTLNAPKVAADSLEIRATYVGYTDTIVRFPMVLTDTIRIFMKLQPKDLQGVTLNAPAIWSRGDTTFHNVDKLKTGSELKLKELLLQLPDFEIDENQILKYKEKPVTKILTDGEELFSEKVNLMINNFPLHLVENIQAIENQSKNPLLKGLEGGNDVVINLKLKKNKIKLGAGDGAVGVDTEGRFSLNAVVFSLLKKTKAGYIGNFSEQGNGVNFAMEREMRESNSNKMDQWLLRTPSLRHLQMFENRYYINNQLRDHRITILPFLSKKTKLKTELNFVNDKQIQQTNNFSSFLSNNEFVTRNDQTNYKRKPGYFHGKQEMKIQLNNTSALRMDINFFDNSTGSVVRENIQQQSFLDTVIKSVNNNAQTILLVADYTKRKSRTNAFTSDLAIAFNKAEQIGLFQSNELKNVFHTTNDFNQLKFDTDNDRLQLSGGVKWLKRNAKQRRYTYGLRLNHERYNIYTSTFLNTQPDTLIKDIGVKGKFVFSQLLTHYQTSGKIKELEFSLNGNLGLAHLQKDEWNQKTSEWHPAYSLELMLNRKKIFNTNHRLQVKIFNEPMQIRSLSNATIPDNVNSYSTYKGPYEMLNNIELAYTLSFRINKIHGFSISHIRDINLKSLASIYNLNKTIYYVTDSLISKPTSWSGINLNYNPYTSTANKLHTYLGYMNSSSFVLVGNDLKKSEMNYFRSSLKYNKNWQKKFFIEISLLAEYRKSKIEGIPDTKPVTNYQSAFKSEWMINKKLSSYVRARYYIMEQITGPSKHYFIADAGVQYKIKKIAFLMDFNNLTNITSYYYSQVSPTYQSQFILPIIPRNISLRVNYAF